MKIDNLCKSVPVECGGCKTQEALTRYLKLEGWIPGTYTCGKCGHKRDVLASPSLLTKTGKVTRIEKTECQRCGHDFLTFKQKA